MNEPRRILFFSLVEEAGASWCFTSRLILRLRNENYSVSMLIPGGGTLEAWCSEHDIPFGTLDSGKSGGKGRFDIFNIAETAETPLKYLARSRNLAEVLRETEQDIVFTLSREAHFISAMTKKPSGVKSVWRVCEVFQPPAKQAAPAAARWGSDAAICTSHFAARPLKSLETVSVVCDGIDTESFSPGAANMRESLRIPADVPVIGAAGPWARGEGHRTMIKTAELIFKIKKNAWFILAGPSMDKKPTFLDNLRSMANNVGIGHRVVFVTDDILSAELFNTFDIFVSPGANPDPAGCNVIRAMSAAKPVVAPWEGCLPELVLNGQTGILLADVKQARLADTILKLTDNPEVTSALGKNGRARAVELFDENSAIRDIRRIIDNL